MAKVTVKETTSIRMEFARLKAALPILMLGSNLAMLPFSAESDLVFQVAHWCVRVCMTGGALFLMKHLLSGPSSRDVARLLPLLIWIALFAVLSWASDGYLLILSLVVAKTLVVLAWVLSRSEIRSLQFTSTRSKPGRMWASQGFRLRNPARRSVRIRPAMQSVS